MNTDHERLVSKFSQTVGVERAEALVEEAAETIGLEGEDQYTPYELEDLCSVIADRYEGYIALVAQEIRVHQQAQQRFEALLERISDPVVVVEFEDNEPIVTWLNPAFQETFGYGSAAVGTSLSALIVPGDDSANGIDHWLVSSDNGQELRRKTADGDVRTFIFRPVTVTREGGRVEGYGIYVDITERKRRECMLENQTEQLEQFASVVSHDLRNPLNVAQGHLVLAREHTESSRVLDHLEAVEESHDRMSALIDSLLTLARDGQRVDDPDSVSLEHVVTAAWAHVDTGDATLRTESLEDVCIAADESRLIQLLENLVRNSVEHGSSSPTVRIGLLRKETDPVGFYVEDDGPGVPADDRDRIFTHGFSTQDSGTGFGLTIVETIADAHGWAVSLADIDDGARFDVTAVEFQP
ncbi:two-component system sensor histidine kinase NtrB [Natrinema halophilum]|uniref:histidine kinase n=1 Tax=Natrinema halophilum TaxID=1699371 RepID=A0A7D5GHG7_9EURY|nr:PAS domain-containing sensor histidine kinase [Natrinema halophilum]QLG49114.1 PAS domain-containing sensor histidine kinase [Natrinema halophilum]